ncbi:hypothetical protein [Planktothrix agardhii]|uniref:hypothetical protein n=1 Tax=Planktothrix agardhii TaxID=1160 RepID=UPI001D0AA9CE|nr:hypothetical protein [Planktothrix agardhii]MCB8764648.1 hypothetical protein [Planktothrix agardhii 1809]MCB8766330.1 hypothetical protein [Planktothrix agardhii 1809]MCB8782705.1 hypothetical protein [Planktothrix agardhii 1808]MCF3566267.1 hypothetical protein [Planktothrix agardhii 1807]CAD5972717.1 hypothetical protein PCC7811_03891 [Planktothrix agardhii]
MMILPSRYHSSNQPQSQADPLSLLPSLLILEDPTAFLTKYVEADKLMREIQQKQAEADKLMREIQQKQAEADKLAQDEIEAKKCNRLINIILNHAKSKGIKVRYLKGESYNDLCDYINKSWPELSDLI